MFSASEPADAFSAAAMRVPDIKDPMIWRDPSHSIKEPVDDLIRRLSLAEKVAQLKNAAQSIPRIGEASGNLDTCWMDKGMEK